MGFLSGCVTLSDDPEASQCGAAAGPEVRPQAQGMPGRDAFSGHHHFTETFHAPSGDRDSAGGSPSFSDPKPSLPESDTSLEPSGPALPEAAATSPGSIQAEGALAGGTILLEAARDAAPALRAHAVEAAEFDSTLANRVLPIALRDTNRGVRFIAIVVVAHREDESYLPVLGELRVDQALSVRAAAAAGVVPSEPEGRPDPSWQTHFQRLQSTEQCRHAPWSIWHPARRPLVARELVIPFAPGTPEAQRRL